ncbi:amino acid adenylation domain-containing protein [Tumebacillus sp. BK434]|uniref:non-ribosomal peptide synthetase n=1 Tax=Tumebacillus sp. BK434 TaxID=2512169 RepID=UPI00104AF382|nr:non-ribosomal peptide synthetase [Tumebacillus sp. BK434]TCP59171.1 amino acid adenylation domain-containing protein [Tumebacillus sp. BK434]
MTTWDTTSQTEAEVYVLRASFAQQRMWILDQLAPGNPFYNMPNAVRLTGKLDAALLTDTINEVIYRHETLRTSFEMQEDGLKQIVRAELFIDIPLTDLQHLPEAERFEKAMELARDEEFKRPFDLSQAPFIRARLLRLADHDHVLLITLHHIISDGWSMGVFFTELSAIYDAFAKDQPVPLPELSIQYADFAEWQHDYLSGQVLEDQLGYWKNRLSGSIPVLQLPADKPRPALQSHNGRTYNHFLSPEVTQKLQAFNQQERATMFMTLLAAYQVLLSRWTGQEDIWVGTPIAGRNVKGIEQLIGFFVNTLVMRSDLSGNPTFRELLRTVQTNALDAFAHQDLPFEKLVEELSPDRNRSHSPLFQVMFALQNTPREVVHLQDLTMSPVRYDNGTSKFDISFNCVERPEGLLCAIEYCSDLFEEATIVRMAEHFENLVTALIDNPEQKVFELPMLTKAEQEQMRLLNGELSAPADDCLHRKFEAQAARTPDNVAVEYAGETLTYRELNARANQLARHLQALGVGPESLVTMCVERSLDLVIAQLGIQKAGGAYVPVDPGNPAERTAFILQDTSAAVMVTTSDLAQGLPAHSAQLVCLDTDRERLASYGEENVESGVAPDNLVYLIYTSGSTGTPKAVAVEHRHVLSTLLATQKEYGFNEDDVVPWIASAAFDIAVFELMSPLLAGGRAVIMSRDHILNMESLLRDLQRVTVMHCVPSLMRRIVDGAKLVLQHGVRYDKLRLLFSGGDTVPPQLLHDLNDTFQSADVHVLYGPTEASILATAHHFKRGAGGEDRNWIGQRYQNAQLYVCDAYGQQVPLGVPGELHIGGRGVARGYFGRDELTGEKFITVDGQRRYKSGDLVRYLPDGSLEFLGRIDGQVKIRGFRVELGEIETVLAQHPAVKQAVLAVFEHQGDKNLAAYLVPEPGQTAEETALRDYLKEKLPEYMVPAAIVIMDALPLNQNGKIDRKALPAPDAVLTAATTPYVEPRTPLEEQIAKIFADLLGVEQVGAEDNFFDRGGHSLLATMAVSRVKDAFKVEFTLADLFETATVAGIAAKVEAKQGTATGGASAIKRVDRSQLRGGR